MNIAQNVLRSRTGAPLLAPAFEFAVDHIPVQIEKIKLLELIALGALAATEQQIKDHALAHAPAYAHPRRVWFVREMPLSGTNKIERKTALQMALDRLAVEGPLA